MHDILVIADPSTADVFRLAAVDVWAVKETDSPEALVRDAMLGDHAVIFVAESVAGGIRNQILAAQSSTGPIVVVIPGVGTSSMLGRDMLSHLKKVVMGGTAMT